MRIRKRFLSSSLSDPQLIRSPVVQPRTRGGALVHPEPNLNSPQPSDPPNPTIGTEGARWVSPRTEAAKPKEVEGEELKDGRWEEEQRKSSSYTRKGGSIFVAGVGAALLPPLPEVPASSDHQDEGRWDACDKSVPLKKRRGSFERERGESSEMKVKPKMKSKTNKKLLLVHCENGEEEVEEAKQASGSGKYGGGVKKVKRGNVIMEGSRCSRVNGRGWRCCQQTLVGYSLCEHHLGKGRLRSMTSVRSRPTTKEESESEILLKQVNVDDELEEDDESIMKKVKLGVVKARSLSSLLGQTNNALAVAEEK